VFEILCGFHDVSSSSNDVPSSLWGVAGYSCCPLVSGTNEQGERSAFCAASLALSSGCIFAGVLLSLPATVPTQPPVFSASLYTERCLREPQADPPAFGRPRLAFCRPYRFLPRLGYKTGTQST
jgi:hypothetical protein